MCPTEEQIYDEMNKLRAELRTCKEEILRLKAEIKRIENHVR